MVQVLLLATALAACSAGQAPPTTPSGSGPAAVSSEATSGTETSASSYSSGSTPPTSDTVSSTAPSADGTPSIGIALPSDALANGLRVSAVIGGGPAISAVVDTGSNGVVVSRRYVGSSATSLSPARTFSGFTYSSSGNTYSGEWMTATVALSATTAGGPTATTAPILVRVVDSECNGGTCNSDAATLSVAMLGVGFDRAAPTGPDTAITGQAINPFLNLQQMARGAMPPAYVITQDQIVLGPTTTDRAGFQTVALTRSAPTGGAAPDWQSAAACVAVPTAGIADQCGTLLLDTGLGYAIVQVPSGVAPPLDAATGARQTVSNGQQLQISVTGISAPIYSFTVGQSGAPTSVQWGHDLSNGQSFMNISRYALSAQDYLYDAADGTIGFRAHS